MTKKDYIIIADMLKVVNTGFKGKGLTTTQRWVFNVIVHKLGNIFYEDNENFNANKFENAIYDQKN